MIVALYYHKFQIKPNILAFCIELYFQWNWVGAELKIWKYYKVLNLWLVSFQEMSSVRVNVYLHIYNKNITAKFE